MQFWMVIVLPVPTPIISSLAQVPEQWSTRMEEAPARVKQSPFSSSDERRTRTNRMMMFWAPPAQ